MELSFTEENYLKTIYHLSEAGNTEVSTNDLADSMSTKPATVTDMVKKLSKKQLVSHQKYRGVNISSKGQKLALKVVRKHRLWEVFLHDKLKFNWDEVHDVAEQLEHVKSPLLVERLDDFLGNPTVDPHGDPIPDHEGVMPEKSNMELAVIDPGNRVVVVGIKNSSSDFLNYLESVEIRPGSKLSILEKTPFDGSMKVSLDNGKEVFLSEKINQELLVQLIV